MSAFPLALEQLEDLKRPSARRVLEALRARRQETGRGELALRLGHAEPAAHEAPHDARGDVGPHVDPPHVDPLGGLLMPGAVVELTALPGSGALTLAFRLLEEAHRRARAEGRAAWLCAVDPTRTLHAPAVASTGVSLQSLVVVQPPEERLLRTATRAARSGAFAGVVVDGSALADVSNLVTGVRRLTLAAEEHGVTCVLLTSRRAARGLPLPVAARALVESALGDDALHVRFLRHRGGPRPRLVLPRRAPRTVGGRGGVGA